MEFTALAELHEITRLVNYHCNHPDPLEILKESPDESEFVGPQDGSPAPDLGRESSRGEGPRQDAGGGAAQGDSGGNAPAKPKSVTFEAQPNAKVGKSDSFVRVESGDIAVLEKQGSGLSLALASAQAETPSLPLFADDTPGGLKLAVWLLGSQSKVQLRVQPSATVVEVIQCVIHLSSKNQLTPEPLHPTSDVYEMRTVEGDGQPDFDFPPLDRARTISSFGDDQFALLIDEKAAASTDAAPAAPSRSAIELMNEKAAGSKQFFKVWLPSKRGVMTISVPPSQTFEYLLHMICKKRNLNPEYYVLERSSPGVEAKDDKDAIDLNVLVQQLNETELTLALKKFHDIGEERQVREHLEVTSPIKVEPKLADQEKEQMVEGHDLPFNPMTAGQYSEYEVTKINRHKTREARVMGIDQDGIHNKVPEKAQEQKKGLMNGLKAAFSSGTKKPLRYIRDVKDIQVIKKSNICFEITFLEDDAGTVKEVSYVYEARSAAVAAEIVAKVNFLRGQS